ncbi:molybdopterin-guanine dinucleotide biosynthesis protein A [Bradyrhizobium canariense]|uniref:Molybdopterin-guanine dinucleotide biosynthesis protein A n=1 Tax=Bradyrhizobium canariense TaxID=255045 RepID=A0ABX3WYM2_9BRAD|nr:DUF3305 domain-containing protein [Bradyrhizobium canariense]OSJ08894.1 molybdopterin-guanine dinucleotide biosynthesis protein A [Bradyrhizobium canariense]OSJ24289.1 molybdopterin-guanine dinucleotide biosynthesis protein A [Bradyrhizobium canariense]
MRSTALVQIPVGVVVERCKAKSRWVDFLWRPVSVLAGQAAAAPWTMLDMEAETALFFAGEAVVALHRTETTNYRDNLTSGAPALWVALRPVASEPPYEILAVTADPSEGEAFTDAGSYVVAAVPMPANVAEAVGRFIVEHHVERPFVKRRRQPAAPEPASSGNRKGAGK